MPLKAVIGRNDVAIRRVYRSETELVDFAVRGDSRW